MRFTLTRIICPKPFTQHNTGNYTSFRHEIPPILRSKCKTIFTHSRKSIYTLYYSNRLLWKCFFALTKAWVMIVTNNALNENDCFQFANCNVWFNWWHFKDHSFCIVRVFIKMGGEEKKLWLHVGCGDIEASIIKRTLLQMI